MTARDSFDVMTVDWAPQPNELTAHVGTDCPGPCTSVTAIVVTPDNLIVTVDVTKRGLDMPGGHIEPGETYLQAAERELLEEAGIHVSAEQFGLVGWTRLRVLAPKPDDYTYPYPDTYQPVVAVRLADDPEALVTNVPEEISAVTVLAPWRALTEFQDKPWWPLLEWVVGSGEI